MTSEKMAPDDAALMDPGVADEARRQAQAARDSAQQARSEAEALLADARAEAQRLVTTAESRASELTAAAKSAEQAAAGLEEHAQLIDHAQAAQQRVDAAERDVVEIAAEYADLMGQVADLTARQAVHGAQREDAAAQLAAALNAGDVDRVTELRARLAAIDEVTGAARMQLDAARARANRIGEEGWGAGYDQALEAAAAAQQARSDVLDAIDPTRPQRRTAASVLDYQQALVAAGVPSEQAMAMGAFVVASKENADAIARLSGGVPAK